MWRTRLSAVALASILAGLDQAALPAGALAPASGAATEEASSRVGTDRRPAPETVVLTTRQDEFHPGFAQGWWSTTFDNEDENTNYFVGPGSLGGNHRNFFTFDVSALGKHVSSATLRINTGRVGGLRGSEIYRLSDVSTDVETLNANAGRNAQIFDDLGTGSVYGEYPVGDVASRQELLLDLNKTALHDLKQASKHVRGGYFSIGGSLENTSRTGFLFGDSGGSVELVVRTR